MTIQIALNSKKYPGLIALIDDEDYELLGGFPWHPVHDGRGLQKRVYAKTSVPGANGRWHEVAMHHVIMGRRKGIEVDHRNHNGLDNQRSNLRECTKSQNQMNRRRNVVSKTGFKGVRLASSGRYTAILQSAPSICLGTFVTPEDAARAYDAAARERHGEFANCNFPTTEGYEDE